MLKKQLQKMISTSEYGPFHELETLLIDVNSGTGASASEQGVIGDFWKTFQSFWNIC